MLESAILEGGLGGNFVSPEEAELLIGKSMAGAEEDGSFRKAADAEDELRKIEEIMGISFEEMKTLYESMAPEDAMAIVLKTFEKIPADLIEKTLLTVDGLKKIGGKIICWASMKSPMEASMIAASVMILTMGEGDLESLCAEIGENDNHIEVAEKRSADGGIHSSDLHQRIM
jgi:hypothetical protein